MVTCSLNLRLLLVDCCAKCFVSTYDPTPTLDQSRSRFIRGQDTGKRIQGAALIPLGAFRLYEPNQAERLPQQRNAKSWKMGLALQSCCKNNQCVMVAAAPSSGISRKTHYLYCLLRHSHCYDDTIQLRGCTCSTLFYTNYKAPIITRLSATRQVAATATRSPSLLGPAFDL